MGSPKIYYNLVGFYPMFQESLIRSWFCHVGWLKNACWRGYFWKSLGSRIFDTRSPATRPQKGAPTFQIVICDTVSMKQANDPNRCLPLKASTNAFPSTGNKASPARRLIKITGRISRPKTTTGANIAEISHRVPVTIPAA